MHDWFSHGKNETENPWLVPLDDDDPWPEHPMPIARTRSDPSAAADGAADLRHRRHALVGRVRRCTGAIPRSPPPLRTGEHGKLKLDAQGLIPQEIESHVDLTGVAGNFWVGLALLHSLFMREHNAVCDHLRATHPELSDDELYDKAPPRRRRADGEDPHGRLDAGDHRPPDDGDGAAHELVGARRTSASTV